MSFYLPLGSLQCPDVSPGDFCLFQNSHLEQQMVKSIKQEPMDCAIEQPPLKKIKQEVLYASTPKVCLKR